MRTSVNRIDAIAAGLEQSSILYVHRLFDRRDMSLTTADVLHRLESDGPSRISALAAATGLSQPTMTQIVQRLEQRGMISRTVDTRDRRVALIAITDDGRELREQRRQVVRERLGALLAVLDSDEQAALELAARVALPLVTMLSEADSPARSRAFTAWA